jgi:hypothetical protein
VVVEQMFAKDAFFEIRLKLNEDLNGASAEEFG